MKEWMQRQIDNNFSDFKGLSIAGRVPLKDALVNELLAEILREGASGASVTAERRPDLRGLLKFVEKAEVHASDGVISLDVVIKI